MDTATVILLVILVIAGLSAAHDIRRTHITEHERNAAFREGARYERERIIGLMRRQPGGLLERAARTALRDPDDPYMEEE